MPEGYNFFDFNINTRSGKIILTFPSLSYKLYIFFKIKSPIIKLKVYHMNIKMDKTKFKIKTV